MHNRTLAAVGYDLLIDPMVDLKVSRSGSLEKVTGVDCIIKALSRRLSTPPNGYARLVRSDGDYVEADFNYQDELYNYLSSPTSYFDDADILTLVQKAASFDPRIEVIAIDNVEIKELQSTVAFDLIYRIESEDTLRAQMTLQVKN